MLIATWNVNSVLARMPQPFALARRREARRLLHAGNKVHRRQVLLVVFQERGYQCQLFGQQSVQRSRDSHARHACETTHRGYPGDDETAQSRLITSTVEGIQIVNVYIPNGQAVGSDKYQMKLAWMSRLREFFDANYDPATPVLLCGLQRRAEERDVHDPRLAGTKSCSASRSALRCSTSRTGDSLTFRLHTEAGGKFTWWDYRRELFDATRTAHRSRLDHRTARLEKRETWIDMEPRHGKNHRTTPRAC